MHFHSYLVKQILEIHHLAAQTAPVYHTLGVDDDGVGYGAQIVRTLCIGVAIGDDELACLLEVSKSIAYCLKRSRASRDEVASLYVYAFNLVFVLGCLYGCEDVVKALFADSAVAHECGEGIVLRTLYDRAVEFDDQYAVVAYRCRCATCCRQTYKADDGQHRDDEYSHEDSDDCREYIFDK